MGLVNLKFEKFYNYNFKLINRFFVNKAISFFLLIVALVAIFLLLIGKAFFYKWSRPLTQMKNGQNYWNNNLVKAARMNQLAPLKTLSSKSPGGILVAADIALSGELKPSHAINAAMIGASFTGVGSVVAGA
ncbi:hypothetical protein P0M11_07970 [Kaistella sp. PBT33-4]|uniref:hypothetical protein n=1 Tax=Kaistella sp. PBT33-4 TaxID=3032000 RepID=UPI0023D7FC91|nr:hypothetical protein [Kaistella sp. PBT33-4]MDF0719934.1 hypothetical protein [Kaistella sp. PBT33-4]